MFALYDYTNFPIVKVDISGVITTDKDFTDFTKQWLDLYDMGLNFEFVFDTKNAGFINIKYCIYMAFFIKLLKKRKTQYLTKSTIFVYNNYIFKLFKFIFYMEPPVAPVYLYNISSNEEKLEIIDNR
tara:strand:- start:593 stop:973 length:381 start_codon:yes stop_codon:yes gene_type:complete